MWCLKILIALMPPPSNQLIVVIVVTGGTPTSTAGISAEALNADGTRLCRLPNLPTTRHLHTMSGSMICGGYYDNEARQTCINFQNGVWKTMPFSLQEARTDAVSWTRSDGKNRILGGYYSRSTSEIVSEYGSISGFPLKYQTWL